MKLWSFFRGAVIVRAESEKKARQLLFENSTPNVGLDREDWFDEGLLPCEELEVGGDPGVVSIVKGYSL